MTKGPFTPAMVLYFQKYFDKTGREDQSEERTSSGDMVAEEAKRNREKRAGEKKTLIK
jgi:hypothetical protein